MSNNKRARTVFVKKSSVVATEFALALMAAQIAYAQQPPDQAVPQQQPPAQAAQPAAQVAQQTAEQVERVEITGSRIPQVNVEGASPVTTLNVQDIKFDGHAKAEDLLNQLPQVYTSQGSNTSNAATGTANVNLRNLGPTRNLVLVNGRRLPPGSPRSGSDSYAADLNQIPAPLIQRVELLTGGASAVYGSDAISGVVNFIMNDRFEGIQIDVDRSFYNHHQHNSEVSDVIAARAARNPSQFAVPSDIGADGAIKNFSLLMGGNFADNKGNATVFFNYKKEDPVLQGARDFSACSLNPSTPTNPNFTCGGSSTSYPGRFFTNGGGGPTFTLDSGTGAPRAFVAATDQFNFGPYNYYRRPSEQWGFSSFAHLDIIPKVRAYSEFSFHDNHTVAQIAPSGIFVGDFTGPNAIHFENPLLTPAWRNIINSNNGGNPFTANGNTADMLIGRRNIEGGGRQDDIRHSSYRGVLGIKGEALQNWNYDAYVQSGKVIYQGVYRNDFSKARISKAMDVITDPVTGQPACRSAVSVANGGTGTDLSCVPYNIWSLGGVTQGALDYLQVPGLQNGYTTQDIFSYTASADLGAYGFKMPAAKNGVGVVLGFEQRKEKLVLETDTSFSTFDLAGQGGPTIGVKGQLDVYEFFGETRVPIIEGRPFAEQVTVSLSYRFSDYNQTNRKTNTYGLGAEWAPVKEYRLRGSYQHAVRHANITELFQPAGNNLFGMDSDPCGGAPTASPAQCARSGVTTNYGKDLLDSPAGQFNFLQGGNTQLKPETANSYTLGLVFAPIKNFTGTVDWWLIKVDDAISNIPPATLLTKCLNDNLYCNLIQRDSQQTLWLFPAGRIVSFNDNLGGFNTNGIDFGLNYGYPLDGGLGTLGFNFLGTWLNKWEFEPIKGQGKFDCAGLIGPQCSQSRGPLPTWRHKVRATWATPWDVQMAVTWRHINKVMNETTSSNPLLASATPQTDRELAARDYIDLAVAWNINKTFTVRAGINNIFDKDPPIVSSVLADPSIFGNGNTFPQMYDTLGRLVFVNAVAKF